MIIFIIFLRHLCAFRLAEVIETRMSDRYNLFEDPCATLSTITCRAGRNHDFFFYYLSRLFLFKSNILINIL